MRIETTDTFGRVDILINNVGITRSSDIQGISLDDWNNSTGVNLMAVFQYSRAVIERKQTAHLLIRVSAVRTRHGVPTKNPQI